LGAKKYIGSEMNEPKRMPCPMNEFSEHATGDMLSMDTAWHYWMQDKYAAARKWWEEQRKKNDKD
jgi:hypothetical protein